MPNDNLPNKNTKVNKLFTAKFDKYEFTEEQKKIMFKDVTDEKGNLMKEWYWINTKTAEDLIGQLKVGDLIEFNADIEVNPDYHNGVKVINPSNIRRLK